MAKPIENRFFWSWDHSTNWCLNTPGTQNTGVSCAYTKEPELFEADYRRVINWCAAHKMTAVGIVGLFRERHGGLDAVRRLCAYGMEKGVKVYLIAGLYAYGGIWYEGDSRYSLERFLAENPQCAGQNEDGTPLRIGYTGRWGFKSDAQGCPSSREMREYVLESLDWVFRAVPELGGIQMETGDSGVCQCPKCKARRGTKYLDPYMSVADMAGIYPAAVETVRRAKPDALVILETYHHFLDESCGYFGDGENDSIRTLLEMPKDILWQWKCDERLRSGKWTENDRLPETMARFGNVMRSHCGTQWWGKRGQLDVERIRRQCLLSSTSGFTGVSMFGELSPFHTNAEMNYRALEYFADDPERTTEDFCRDIMAPLLGGESAAGAYLDYAMRAETAPEKIPEAVTQIARITGGMTEHETLRRWNWLSSFLNSFWWEYRETGRQEHGKNSDALNG